MEKKPAPPAASQAAPSAAPNDAAVVAPKTNGSPLPPKLAQVFSRLLQAAMKLLYSDPKITKQFVDMVKNAPDPVAGIVSATKAVVVQIANKVQGVPLEIVEKIAGPVSALVAEIAIASGIVKDSPELAKQVDAALAGGGPAQEPGAEPGAEPSAPPVQPPGLIQGQMQQAA